MATESVLDLVHLNATVFLHPASPGLFAGRHRDREEGEIQQVDWKRGVLRDPDMRGLLDGATEVHFKDAEFLLSVRMSLECLLLSSGNPRQGTIEVDSCSRPFHPQNSTQPVVHRNSKSSVLCCPGVEDED